MVNGSTGRYFGPLADIVQFCRGHIILFNKTLLCRGIHEKIPGVSEGSELLA